MDKKAGLKILFILPEYYPHSGGGISTYYLNYIAALKPYCEKIKVITGSGYVQANESLIHNDVTIEYLKPKVYQEYLVRFSKYDLLPDFRNNLAAAWAMWKQAAQDDDFDMIECTDFGLGFIPWVIHHKKPVITRLHGSSAQIALHENAGSLLESMYSNAELNLLPLCDSLITHSKANQAFWNNILPSKLINLIYPVYSNMNRPLPYADREDFGLVTARVQKWKGPEQLCSALSNLSDPPPVKWIGRDMPFDEQRSTAEYLKKTFPAVWGQKIVAQSSLPYSEIQLLQQKAKFGIVPSTWDMFNFTGLEFMAAGTIVICSAGAGVSELIEHGKNGFTFPTGDTAALTECIRAVNNLDEHAYNTMINAGSSTISTTLSPQALIPANLQHYQLVIDNFKPSLPNAFINDTYIPTHTKYSINAILDKQPLKKLLTYIYKRLKSKFTRN